MEKLHLSDVLATRLHKVYIQLDNQRHTDNAYMHTYAGDIASDVKQGFIQDHEVVSFGALNDEPVFIIADNGCHADDNLWSILKNLDRLDPNAPYNNDTEAVLAYYKLIKKEPYKEQE